MKPVMFYFGPWDRAGHFMFRENGSGVYGNVDRRGLPWHEESGTDGIDCQLQPGCHLKDGRWKHGPEVEGEALIHHKGGWTALSFWDRSVDRRGGCNSTYFAEGTFTFEQMVEMASQRFSSRWGKMAFTVVLKTEPHA